jgi:peptidoglycan/LPS O-acetylase OafA/YrhL
MEHRVHAPKFGASAPERLTPEVGAFFPPLSPPAPPKIVSRLAAARGAARDIPSLDGLRAISIALVLLSHLGGTAGFPASHQTMSFFALGTLGVQVFFVISGFLITTLLLRELDETGSVSLRRFYFRRTLRIFPPYYAFLAAIAIAAVLGWVSVAGNDLFHAFTYTSNYNFDREWNLGHTWSLGVEEQFYLLWPAVLVLLGRRRGLTAAAAFVVAAPLVRVGIWYLLPDYRPAIGNSFETVADALAIGCLLAGTRDLLWEQPAFRRFLASWWMLAAPAVIGVFAALDRPRTNALVGTTVMSVAIALIIERCVRFPEDRIGQVLNSRPFRFVGVLSYSIYLWQQPFLNRDLPSPTTSFPLNLALVFAAALASYYVVERPSLRFRQLAERRLWPKKR